MDNSRAVYYCQHERCSYVTHTTCATKHLDAVQDRDDDDDRIISQHIKQIKLEINHFSHPHVLALINKNHQDNGHDDDRIITRDHQN